MINLIIALISGAAAYALTGFAMGGGGFEPLYGILPGLIALIGVYVLLARRTLKQVEAIMTRAQAELAAVQEQGLAFQEKAMAFQEKAMRLMQAGANPRNIDAKKARSLMDQQQALQAQQKSLQDEQDALQETFRKASLRSVEVMKEALPLKSWQFLIESQINGQIGTLYYINREPEQAEPFLRAASQATFSNNWIAFAMLAALLYKRGDADAANATFEKAARSTPKESLLWAAWAWTAWKAGDTDKAIGLLARGRAAGAPDPRLQANLLELQNAKDLDMAPWGELWYQLFLEEPKMDMPEGAGPKASPRIPYMGKQRRSPRAMRG